MFTCIINYFSWFYVSCKVKCWAVALLRALVQYCVEALSFSILLNEFTCLPTELNCRYMYIPI